MDKLIVEASYYIFPTGSFEITFLVNINFKVNINGCALNVSSNVGYRR